jgi:hypothetical protein
VTRADIIPIIAKPQPGLSDYTRFNSTAAANLCKGWDMKFEWDPEKARLNFRKHKVSFEEAATALSDPMAATGYDPDHSNGEERFVTFGVSERGRLLVVAHIEKDDALRIISARVASKGERKIYEEA